MKTSLLLFHFCFFITASYSQGISFNLGYVYDLHAGKNWFNERGARMGLGFDGVQFQSAPFNASMRYNISISKSKEKVRLDDVTFDMPDTTMPNIGYARADFRKIAFSMDYDLGYSQTEDDIFVPYVTIGPRLESYNSNVHYELYPSDTCDCTYPADSPLTSTLSLGYNTGLGFRLRFGVGVAIDVRANYYGGWSMIKKDNVILPNASTFSIDVYGNPGFEFHNSRYNDGFTFSINVIVPFPKSNGFSSSWQSDDSDDDSWSNDDNTDYESTGSSGCESIELSPSGRGGGGN